MNEVSVDCGQIKQCALLIGQTLRGDFDGPIRGMPLNFTDKPDVDELKKLSAQMAELAFKVNNYIQGLT